MLSPKQLEEFLDVLRDKGATQFTCPEFSVVLGAEPVEAVDNLGKAIEQAKAEAAKPRVARGLLGHPSLWPNGVATFPGRQAPSSVPTHADEDEE